MPLLDEMGERQIVYAIFVPFYEAQSFKMTHATKFVALPPWIMFRIQSTFGVGGSNNVVEAFILGTFYG